MIDIVTFPIINSQRDSRAFVVPKSFLLQQTRQSIGSQTHKMGWTVICQLEFWHRVLLAYGILSIQCFWHMEFCQFNFYHMEFNQFTFGSQYFGNAFRLAYSNSNYSLDTQLCQLSFLYLWCTSTHVYCTLIWQIQLLMLKNEYFFLKTFLKILLKLF